MKMHFATFAQRLSVWPWIVILILPVLMGWGCASSETTNNARTVAGVYSFWPPLPDEPRVQFLKSFRFSSDVEARQSALDQLVFGTEQQVLPIGKPYGVAMWDGKMYVCDIINPSVVILDLRRQQARIMDARGVGTMQQPTDIAVARDGMKYVVDLPASRVFVFNAQDQPVAAFGWPDFKPVSAAVYEDNLYVADFETQSILVLDRYSGERRGSIGEAGGEDGQFIRPLGVAVDREGNIYVTDVIRGTLQKFSPEGELLMVQGELGDTAGNFVRPKHLDIDSDGIIYVVDAAFQNVQMFNDDGEVLMFFGSAGSHPGSMSLPAGIDVVDDGMDLFADLIHPAFDAQALVLVSNQFGLNKVAVYALGKLKEGRTIADVSNRPEMNTGLTTDPETNNMLPPERSNADTSTPDVAPQPIDDEPVEPVEPGLPGKLPIQNPPPASNGDGA
jgi:hypothetical protein